MRANPSAGRAAEPLPAPPASPRRGGTCADAPPSLAALPAIEPAGAGPTEPAAAEPARAEPARAGSVPRNLLAAAGVLLFYAALCLLYFRSLAGTLSDRILGLSGDPVFNLYVLKWSAHQLAIGLPDLWNANFFYPARGALAFSDHLLGPAAQLLALLGLGVVPNAVAGYNLLLLSSFLLSAATTAWVLRQSGRSWLAAALGGAMYAFAPLRWAHLDHIQILLVQWAPLTLWFWHRLLAEVTWRRAALFLPCYLLHLSGGCYLAYIIHVPMLAMLASRIAAGWRPLVTRRSLAVLLATVLPAALAVWWLFAPYAEAARRYRLERAPEEVALYAATLPSYLAPSDRNLYAPLWHRLADRSHVELSQDESRLFSGLLATGFGALGVLSFYRSSRRRPAHPMAPWQRWALGLLALAAAGAFVIGDLRTLADDPPPDPWRWPGLACALAGGAWLLARRRWGGSWPLRGAAMDPWERGLALGGALCFLLSFPLVFVPLAQVVPGLVHLRAPGRFHAITAIAVVAFAARGVDTVLPAAGRRRLAAGICLALFLALESMPAGLESRPLRDTPDFPAVYRYLGSTCSVHAVLELPRLRPARESLYMYYSTLHWKPIANGYSGFIPGSDGELRAGIEILPDDHGFALLRQLGISHLVLHTQGSAGRPIRQRLDAWEARFLHREVERVFESEGDLVYALTGGGGPAKLASG